ncbi:hypothetical protein ACQJBY_065225 [Aegilops geniculata]
MGTEEMEAVILTGVLRRAGADVTLASVEDGLEVEASYGTRIIADKSIAACADQVFDLVALPVTHLSYCYYFNFRYVYKRSKSFLFSLLKNDKTGDKQFCWHQHRCAGSNATPTYEST